MRKALFSLSIYAVFIFLTQGCSHTPVSIAESPTALENAANIKELVKMEEIKSTTWDVTKTPLSNHPWLNGNDETRFRLEMLKDHPDWGQGQAEEMKSILSMMQEMSIKSQKTAMKGLNLTNAEMSGWLEVLSSLHRRETEFLGQMTDQKEQQKWVKQMLSEHPPENLNGGSTKRMLLTFPLVPVMYGWIWNHTLTEDKGPYPHDFENLKVFTPDTSHDQEYTVYLATATDEELLQLYSPIVIQQTDPQADYPAEDNSIGAVRVIQNQEGELSSKVDPSDPTVYSYTTNAWIDEQWHKQLNYSLWYPEHPEMVSHDPEAGHTEGVLIRVTLDQSNHPIIVETCFACGCFHRVFPVEALERAATEQFGRTVSGRSPMGKRNTHRVDAIIPQHAGIFNPKYPHPLVYIYAGKHFAGAVEFGGYYLKPESTTVYQLQPESEMEQLPVGEGHYASFYDKDGLVRGADRPEATLLYPTGFYHAGTPRIRNTHLIHFDQYDYNAPDLLMELLRIPSLGGVLEDSVHSPYAPSPDAPKMAISPSKEDQGQQRADKKAFFCPC